MKPAHLMLMLGLCTLPGAVSAQRAALQLQPTLLQSQSTGGAGALLLESAGGAAGSALGFGVVYLLAKDCDGEDLACNLENAFGAMAAGTVASAAGAYLAGRMGNTQPSGWGATIGSVLGAGAAIGTWHLFTEELDVVNGQGAVVITYALTQGLLTGIGSRIGRALSR